MLTENREFNEIYEQYKHEIQGVSISIPGYVDASSKRHILIQAVIVQRKILLKTLF